MVERKYISGFEGEGEVFIYYLNGDKKGLLIWEGYFEFLLASCYYNGFQDGGLLEAYYHHNGFYDDSPWHLKYPQIMITELEHFSLKEIETTSADMVNVIIKLKEELVIFLKTAILEKKEVFIEYN